MIFAELKKEGTQSISPRSLDKEIGAAKEHRNEAPSRTIRNKFDAMQIDEGQRNQMSQEEVQSDDLIEDEDQPNPAWNKLYRTRYTTFFCVKETISFAIPEEH